MSSARTGAWLLGGVLLAALFLSTSPVMPTRSGIHERLRPVSTPYGHVTRVYAEGLADRPNLGAPPIYRFLVKGNFQVASPLFFEPGRERPISYVRHFRFGEVFVNNRGEQVRWGLSADRIVPPPLFRNLAER